MSDEVGREVFQDRPFTSGDFASEDRRRLRIELAEQDPIRFRHRLRRAAEHALLFTVRWGIAIVLLGMIARLTLTELLVPPIYRLVMSDLAAAKNDSGEAKKTVGQTVGYLELLIDRGVLPKGQVVGTMPKAEWAKPFVLEDKPQAPEPAK